MERVLSWLNQPLFPDTVIRVWMAVAAGLCLSFVLCFASLFFHGEEKKDQWGGVAGYKEIKH